MPNEMVKVSAVSVLAIVASTSLPVLVERAGGRPASPGRNFSTPSITIRTPNGPISGRCGGF
jgi:hypothetical protein